MKKRILALVMVFCMAFAFTSCGNKDGGSSSSGDGVLDVCIASEPMSIDPAVNSAVDGAIMLQHAYEGLVKWVDDGKGNAVLEPGMAESWDVSKDGLEWTFHLRDGLKWSDGSDLTAKDFVYAWNRAVSPDTAADYEYMFDMVAGYDKKKLEISAPDDKTFKVKLSVKTPYFEEICAFPTAFPVKKDVVKGNKKWTFKPETYVSNGPYKMTEWKHNSKIVFEKNENYYDQDRAKVEKIVFHLMDDENAIYAGYKSGELDFIEQVPQEEIKGLLDAGDLKVKPQVGTYYVCFNTAKKPFNDPRVRKAFSLTMDREFITKDVTGTGEEIAEGYVPTGVNDAKGPEGDDFRKVGGSYYDGSKDGYKKNCEEARKLMKEAGYENGKGFPVVEYLYNTEGNHKAIGEALQSMWENELGVKVTLQNQEWAVFLKERKDGNFSIARNGWIADYNDPMSFIDMWMTGGGNNDAQYSNPEYDKLVKAAKKTEDPKKRMELMHKAEDILVKDDCVVAPLYFYTNKYMMKENIKGMYYTPLGYFFFNNVEGV